MSKVAIVTGGARAMLDRLGTPADIAQLVAFLATSEPCFITGQHFVVDGFQWSC